MSDLVDCSGCHATTSEWIELDEVAICGDCVKSALVPIKCCLCDYSVGAYANLPSHKQAPAYCVTCLDALENARDAEKARDGYPTSELKPVIAKRIKIAPA